MYGKYSVFNMMKLYRDNKPIIHAYLKGHSVEGYTDSDDTDGNDPSSAGVFAAFGGIAVFLIIMAINIAIWIWALIWTMKYWKVLPSWAQVLAVLGLLGFVGGGAIMTLIVVFIGKNSNGGSKQGSSFGGYGGSKQGSSFGGCGSW